MSEDRVIIGNVHFHDQPIYVRSGLEFRRCVFYRCEFIIVDHDRCVFYDSVFAGCAGHVVGVFRDCVVYDPKTFAQGVFENCLRVNGDGLTGHLIGLRRQYPGVFAGLIASTGLN